MGMPSGDQTLRDGGGDVEDGGGEDGEGGDSNSDDTCGNFGEDGDGNDAPMAQVALQIAILLRRCPRGYQVVIKVAATVTAQAAMLVRMEMAALAMATTQAAL